MQLKELLKQMIDVKASDVFINAGLPLSYQASGVHVRTDGDPLTPAKSKEYIEGIYELAGRDISIFEANINHDDDFSFAIPGVGLPRQHLPSARFVRRGYPRYPVRPAQPRGNEHPRFGYGSGRYQQGPGAGNRSCRQRQVYHPCLPA